LISAVLYAGVQIKCQLTRSNRRWKSIAKNLKKQGLDTVHLCAALMNTPDYTFHFLNQYQTNKHLAFPHVSHDCSSSLQDLATFFENCLFFAWGTFRAQCWCGWAVWRTTLSTLKKLLYITQKHPTAPCYMLQNAAIRKAANRSTCTCTYM